ncbi:MAG: hypothetical protein CFE43_08200 [Burkholderiales bacterium PBB3]|nr:MAG: hypothetical protein CFE43_08200 [Burkholderiales bacterium PBB3]
MPTAPTKPSPQAQQLKSVITARAVANPTHLCADLAAQFGVSRSTMGKWLRPHNTNARVAAMIAQVSPTPEAAPQPLSSH